MHLDSERKIYNRMAVLVLGIVGIGLFVRSFYSFTWSDESYYLTVVHRFWLGERMIADEWFASQLNAPLLLPFYALYRWIMGGNEGVYLFFRLLYLGISMMTAVYVYCCMKRRNSVMVSLSCALLYLLYSRANIGGMSYYNLTLTFMVAAVFMLYGQICEKNAVGYKMYFTGILLALAVVNTPYLAIPYLIVTGYFLLRRKYRVLRKWVLFVLAGTGTAAFVYMGYVLYKVPVNELFFNIPYILSEPEIQKDSMLLVVPLILVRIAWRFKWTIWVTVLLMLYIAVKKKRGEVLTIRQIYVVTMVNLLIFIVNSYLSVNMIGCINIAGVLFLIPVIGIFKSRKMDKLTFMLFLTAGLSMILGFSFSSDTGLDAIAIGFVVLGMGALLLVFQTEEVRKLQLIRSILIIVMCVMIFQTAILRFFSVYRDAPINQLNTRIEDGPAKFLYTTEEHAGQYEELKAAIEKYVREEDVVFYSKECFWSYLCSDNAYGVSSSWRMPFDSQRLELYYRLKPEKIPTCIFLLSPEYGSSESSLIQGNEKIEQPNANHVAGYLYEYIKENNYEKIELECAAIYRRR